jgi:FAD/FMN-containing dehydrogenase
MKIINESYFRVNKDSSEKIQHYKPFFFPLDVVDKWGRAYGKKGFLQYQFVVPNENGCETMKKILSEIKINNQIPALGVLKTFGDIESKGYMSFPRKGLTLALDFRIKDSNTFKFLERLDKIVIENGGSLYPAKDARMSSDSFNKSFTELEEFKKYIDPKFSSSFWRRVNKI